LIFRLKVQNYPAVSNQEVKVEVEVVPKIGEKVLEKR
jgi:hypothetical protein